MPFSSDKKKKAPEEPTYAQKRALEKVAMAYADVHGAILLAKALGCSDEWIKKADTNA